MKVIISASIVFDYKTEGSSVLTASKLDCLLMYRSKLYIKECAERVKFFNDFINTETGVGLAEENNGATVYRKGDGYENKPRNI